MMDEYYNRFRLARSKYRRPLPLGGEGQGEGVRQGKAIDINDEKDPSSAPAGHLLPQGEKGEIVFSERFVLKYYLKSEYSKLLKLKPRQLYTLS
jgi:hypothetical protein